MSFSMENLGRMRIAGAIARTAHAAAPARSFSQVDRATARWFGSHDDHRGQREDALALGQQGADQER